MPRIPRLKSRSGIYHVIYRGASRQEIFHDEDDNMRFLETILRYKKISKIKVYAWCLMNNHVHLLLKEGTEEISMTLRRISVSYVHYYHSKYQTTGHLFQDRFRSENVDSRRYLFAVIRYIHQNPLKAGIVEEIGKWKWSSYHGYFNGDCYPKGLLDEYFILEAVSSDLMKAREMFRAFNNRKNDDEFLEGETIIRLTDENARLLIKEALGNIEIPQLKSLPRAERNFLLRKVKTLEGISQRQAARILGISASLINRV